MSSVQHDRWTAWGLYFGGTASASTEDVQSTAAPEVYSECNRQIDQGQPLTTDWHDEVQ